MSTEGTERSSTQARSGTRVSQPAPHPHELPAPLTRTERRLRAIFFDIDDTLYSTSEFATHARLNAVEAMIAAGLKMQREDCLRELGEVIAEFTSNHEQHFDKFLARIPPHYYEGVNPLLLVAAGILGYHETKHRELKAYEDVVEVLKRLRQHTDLTLGIVTSGRSIKQAEKLLRIGVYPYIHTSAVFISDQVGIGKPNVKLYQHACRQSGVRPHQAMYVGDNPPMDVDPPNAIGMVTVHSARSGKHVDALSETPPDYTIQNFWDLLDLLERDFGVVTEVATTDRSAG